MPKNPHPNNWYVITGAPSSGKTTTVTALQQKGYKTVSETARTFIDLELAKGKSLDEIRNDERLFQDRVLDMKIVLEQNLIPQDTIFFDRGIPDTLAYYELNKWPVPNFIKNAVKKTQYRKVFLFEMLSFEKDYARKEALKEAKALHKLLTDVYKKLKMEIIYVPKMSIEERVNQILSEVA